MTTPVNNNSPVGAAAGGGSATGANSLTGGSASSLEQTFLQLLVAQLQNQDPTNPMDSSQMTSQLAQISTVSGISTLNSSLTSLASQLGATQQLEANSLIGQGVLTAGSNITVTNTTDSSGKTTQVASPAGVQISGPTSDLTVTIKDASGNIVQKIDLGPQQSAGVVPFEWNGQNSSGAAVPNGNYTYTAAAADSGVTATALTFGVVQGVTADPSGSGTDVTLNNGSNVPLSAIVETL